MSDTLKKMSIAKKSSELESETASLTTPRSSMMCERSTDCPTVVEWIASLPVSRVRLSQKHLEGDRSPRKTYGLKQSELFSKLERPKSFSKTSQGGQLFELPATCGETRFLPRFSKCRRKTWARITFGPAFGYVHTPTAKANFAAPVMQKHQCCLNFMLAFGKPTPANFEYLMGWPLGATDLEPLEMESFRQWREKHGCD